MLQNEVVRFLTFTKDKNILNLIGQDVEPALTHEIYVKEPFIMRRLTIIGSDSRRRIQLSSFSSLYFDSLLSFIHMN